MRKTRKRVFAAVLAAALLFTMPGMASYAEAEDAQTKDISESVTVQAEDDTAEETEAETEAEVMQEPEAEDSDTNQPETGEDVTGEADAQEPAEEEIVPAQKEDTKECTCGTLCTQDSINGDCPVCGVEDADLSRCKGEKTENSSEKDSEYEDADTDTKECTCGTLCTQDSINGDCPVCGAEDADLSRCKGEKTALRKIKRMRNRGILAHRMPVPISAPITRNIRRTAATSQHQRTGREARVLISAVSVPSRT